MAVVSHQSTRFEPPSEEDVRTLIQRVVESAELRRAPRLRALLQYLCDRAFEEPGAEIREQELGAQIFGRPQNYDTSEDPIVRVQVSQLRKRLKQYFATEGKHEAFVIEIPRGSYLPVFLPRSPNGEANLSEVAPESNKGVAMVVVAGMAVAVALLWWGTHPKSQSMNLAVARFWGNLIQPNQRTTLILADSCLAFAQDIAHEPVTLREYLTHDPQSWFAGAEISQAELRDLKLLMTRQYTSLADLGGMRRILLANPRGQQQLNVVFARDFRIRDVNSDNLILFGSRRSNPWVELFDGRLNFEFDYDEPSMKAFIRNRSPRPGEQQFYRVSGLGLNISEGYADIALVPSAGGSRKALLLEGTDMEATEAAGAIVTNESELSALLSRLSPKASAIPFFEALYKTHRLAGAPEQTELMLVRKIMP